MTDPETTEQDSLSIGVVLQELRGDFADVTISKIRFLESQGLVDPDRTPSGYRRFTRADVERLRWILRQQKEHFLPLKVIKERIATLDLAAEEAPTPARRSRARRAAGVPSDAPRATAVLDDDAVEVLDDAASGAILTRTELAKAAGISDEQLGQLEEYGLVAPTSEMPGRALFDEDALITARVAASFMRHGIEPRHLRMYLAFAEREAALFAQVLLPYRRQRNPQARARAEEALGELATLGRRLRTTLLRQAVRRSG
jgi:DNA-binding transcriptional MerR regulator